jgi:hypothetical protein
LRRRRFGSNGSIRDHKSSSIKAWGMPDRLTSVRRPYQVLNRSTRRQSVNFATRS